LHPWLGIARVAGIASLRRLHAISMTDGALAQITELLIEATKQIAPLYFQLPVAGLEEPIFRERVYCYELYHQMRLLWPDVPYRVTGEIDKTGHPWIYGNELDRSKPDFTIHVPGYMSDNLLVIEVKSPNPTDEQIVTDLRKLTGYCRKADYFAAYYLIYGRNVESAQEFAATCVALSANDATIDLLRITLFTHPAAYTPASSIAWPQKGLISAPSLEHL
jgi:hypothetical protein